jgi:hypothetical protein
MAQKSDREYGTPAEADRTAVSRDVQAFRQSVHRPRRDFLQQ